MQYTPINPYATSSRSDQMHRVNGGYNPAPMPPHCGGTFWDGYFDQCGRILSYASRAGGTVAALIRVFK